MRESVFSLEERFWAETSVFVLFLGRASRFSFAVFGSGQRLLDRVVCRARQSVSIIFYI